MSFFTREKLSFTISLTVAVILLLSNKENPDAFSRLKATVIDANTPILELATKIAKYPSKIVENIINIKDFSEQNEELREKVKLLERYLYVSKKLEIENQQLKQLLNVNIDAVHKFNTARVIGRTNSNNNQQLIINSGSDNGIEKWQPVIVNNQLVGRIIEVNKKTAKVLLISDGNSSIPVIAVRSKTRFVATGGNLHLGNYLSCKYLTEQNNLQEGELVVTNSDTIEIPANIIIGLVYKKDNNLFVKPSVQFHLLDFVQVIQTDDYKI